MARSASSFPPDAGDQASGATVLRWPSADDLGFEEEKHVKEHDAQRLMLGISA
jgi:hypothetical protein